MEDQVSQLEKLKFIKRKARALYGYCRNLYISKLKICSRENGKIFQEAINALDAMCLRYEALKGKMRKKSLTDQIKFAEDWSAYVSCIEALVGYKTNDKYLLDGISLKKSFAERKAVEIWKEFNPSLLI